MATVLHRANLSVRRRKGNGTHDGLCAPMLNKHFEGLGTLALDEESARMAEKSAWDKSCLY